MFIIKYKKIFFGISLTLVSLSLLSVAFFGINWGLDFTGGSILEVEYQTEKPEILIIEKAIESLEVADLSVQPTGDLGYIIRLSTITQEQKNSLDGLLTIEEAYQFEEVRFSSIGPVLGDELYRKGLWAIALVVSIILLFVAFAFSGVGKPVASWKYGVATIVALAHDIIIPIGVMSVLGKLYGLQIDALFLTALLAILGLSVNDSIVVFDRVRENLKNQKNNQPFEEIVGKSLNETFTRSLNTSLTTVVVLLTLFFMGGETTKVFAGILALGMIIGTYSSIFLAAPLLTTFKRVGKKA